mgnify:CR=1 FL=1
MNPLVCFHRDCFATWSTYTHLWSIWPKRRLSRKQSVELDLQFLRLYRVPPLEGDILHIPYIQTLAYD